MNVKILKRYAQFVCIFTAIFFILYSAIAAYSGYKTFNPAVTTIEEFTYETATSSKVLFGISENNRYIFEELDNDIYKDKKKYLFGIASTDHKENVPIIFFRSLVYILLHGTVFYMHFNILRRIKRFGV